MEGDVSAPMVVKDAIMETVEINVRTSWLLRAFGRNPLVRSSDRWEAIITALTVVVVILMLPVAGAVGTAVYYSEAVSYARAAATYHSVAAEVTADSAGVSEPYVVGTLTPIRWIVDGQLRTDVVHSRHWYAAGGSMPIWVDDRGMRVAGPPNRIDPALTAVGAALVVCAAAIVAGAALLVVVRCRLDRRRYAAWDAEVDDIAGNGGGRKDPW